MIQDRLAARGLLRDPVLVGAVAIAVVVALGFGLVAPILPLLARQFGVSLFAITSLVSVFAGVRLVSNLYSGALSDRWGSRRAICAGVGVVAVSSALIAVAPNYWWLLAVRGAGGFGSALFINAMTAMVIRVVPPSLRARALGTLQGGFLVGTAFGPAVGGVLAEPLGLRWPFVIYAALLVVAGGVAWWLLPQVSTDVTEQREPGLRPLLSGARDLCADRAFVAALVMMAASSWSAQGMRFSLIPVFAAEQVGASSSLLGTALTLAALVQLALLWPAGHWSDTLGRRRLGIPAYAFFAVATAALGLVGSVAALLVALALYGAGTGLTAVTPRAVVADVTPLPQAGLAVGVLNTAGDLGVVLGLGLSGLLADLAGYRAAFGAAATVLAVAALAAVAMRETVPSAAARTDGDSQSWPR